MHFQQVNTVIHSSQASINNAILKIEDKIRKCFFYFLFFFFLINPCNAILQLQKTQLLPDFCVEGAKIEENQEISL